MGSSIRVSTLSRFSVVLPQSTLLGNSSKRSATEKDEVGVAASLPRPRPIRENGEILHASHRPPLRTITRAVEAVRPDTGVGVYVPSQAVPASASCRSLSISTSAAE